MRDTERILKGCAKVSIAALFVLLVGSIVFFKERILFSDSAFKTFNIIRNDAFSIDLMRYGSFVSQLIPYLAQKLHLPIKVIVIGYSLGFNLFYCLVGLLLYRTRQYSLVILMTCYFLLVVSDSYYWPNDELHQAVGWMFVLLGATLYFGERKTNMAIIVPCFLVLAFLTVFTHFVVLLPLAFLWGYLWLEQKQWPFSRNISLLLTGLLAGVIALKFMLTGNQTYDGPNLHKVTHFSFQDIGEAFCSSVVTTFFARCLNNYWVAPLLLIAGLVGLFRQNRLLFAYTLLACIGYVIVVGLAYADSSDQLNNIYLFHLETEWTSIGIFMATPFVFAVLGRLRMPVAMALLAAVFMVRLIYIGSSAPRFTWRTHAREQLLSKMKQKGITKVGIYRDPEINKKYILDWALPYECMITSMMNNDTVSRTAFFFDGGDAGMLPKLADPKAFYDVWNVIQWTNRDRYFVFDTTTPYRVMSYEQLMK